MTPPSTDTYARRWTVTFFVAAVISVVLAFTTGWWVPALATLLGIVEANRDLIGALADLAQIATFMMLVIGFILGFLGFRSLQSSNAGAEARRTGEVVRGGRGAAVAGDVNQGAVVVGDNNQVSVYAGSI